jgi:hypothetical protein
MQTVKFEQQSNKADFAFEWPLTTEGITRGTGVGDVDFTGMVIACAIMDADNCYVTQIRSDDGDGNVVISGETISFKFPQTMLAHLSGTYGIGCTYLDADNTKQLFLGSVAFLDGIAVV